VLEQTKETDLDGVEFLLCAVPLVGQLDDGSGALADSYTLTGAIVLELAVAGDRGLATILGSTIRLAAAPSGR
jgi:hypothetical protein